MIELYEVWKRYGDVIAVGGIEATVERGEIIGLVGPNGAGKTTTMKMITGYVVPDSGEIFVDGIDVAAEPTRAQARIGYLPEHNPLYPEMAVQTYLEFVARMRGLGGAVLRERMGYAIAACSLEGVVTRRIRQLSKGYRQRVGIAQAIVHDPDILILDEPTSGLDPNQIADIRELVRDLGRDKTVILSTHILSEVEETCSRAIMIVGGRIAVDERIDRLAGGRRLRLELADAPADVRDRLVASPAVADVRRLGDEAGLARFEIDPRDGADAADEIWRLAVREGWRVRELARDRRSLEEVFREASAVRGERS